MNGTRSLIISLTLKCQLKEVPLLSHRPTPTPTTTTTITSQFRIFGGKFKCELRNAKCEMQIAKCELRIVKCKMRIAKCKMLFSIKNSIGSALNPLCQRTCCRFVIDGGRAKNVIDILA